MRAVVALFVLLLGGGGVATAASGYRGTLTLARDSANDRFNPATIVDLDLASDKATVRFDGFDPHRTRTGETAFLTRLAAGTIADYGVVAADARGVPGAPLYVCRSFSFTSNRICHTPKLSPDGQRVAFGTAAGGGKLCKNDYKTAWADYVVVRDRKGAELARFEGYYFPAWLPDGRLLMLGSGCRGAGVWIAGGPRTAPARVDGNQIATPAKYPAISPDGRRVALVWNNQLWILALDGKGALGQATHADKPVTAAAWSPDGSALAVLLQDVSMPVKAVMLFRLGEERAAVMLPLPFYPFAPLSWN